MPKLRPFSKSERVITQSDLDHELLIVTINNMSEGVLTIDEAGKITLTNSAALSLLDSNNLQGVDIDKAFKLIDKTGKAVDLKSKILGSQQTMTSDSWRFKYGDGSAINLYISSSPVRSGYGQRSQGGYVIILRDISQQKAVEEEREEFVSVASHELRTPVAIVEGNISNAMLLAERSPVSDAIKQSLAEAHDQILFLGNLINDLSMLSRAERGKLAVNLETFDVSELIDSLVHDYEPQAAQKKLSFKKQLGSGLGSLRSSPLYVREMLQNFITNALKYTEKGGISVSATRQNDGVEFSVSDTGIGISQSEQSELFGKFFRANDWRVRKVNGTGLGLYVTSKLAKLLGASIHMESELNKGSKFSLYVPNIEKKTGK